ncbi:hypothetical protein J1N35_001770 [Gossypium stocksii]|uniref:Retrotransposon gag domain-containing protein n=1 Tax=Gossypium stocksii TaxID=47602 RepID=A0A9D3WIE0_9ROSI|nr:hypothetical protein J1N35_001770 [Gossypium stocksii]
MLQEILTYMPIISTDPPPKLGFHSTSQPIGSSIIGPHKLAPIQFPRFSSTNPDCWVFQAKHYFPFYNIQEQDRLIIASFYLDNDASEWFNWVYRNKQLSDWTHFTSALVKRFWFRELKSPEGQLAKLQQTSTVQDYCARFEAITNHTMFLP